MNNDKARIPVIFYVLLVVALAGQVMVWAHLRPVQAEWGNVPPAPSENVATMWMLGDKQMAYRTIGIIADFLRETDPGHIEARGEGVLTQLPRFAGEEAQP